MSAVSDRMPLHASATCSVAFGSQCAGVTRYELAQLYDLTGEHVEALLIHAINREQYPDFYRGRYRLAMSLEMIASLTSSVTISEAELPEFAAVPLAAITTVRVKCWVAELTRRGLSSSRVRQAYQLLSMTLDLSQRIVGELAPLLLDLTCDLLPVACYTIPVHLHTPLIRISSRFTNWRAAATITMPYEARLPQSAHR